LEDEKIRVARDLRRRGYTLEEISRQLDISVGTAWKYTRDLFDDRVQILADMIEELAGALSYTLGYLAGCVGIDPESEEFDELFEEFEKFESQLRKWKKKIAA